MGKIKSIFKDMKYWYSKDENGQINDVARITFEFFVFLPLIIFEGIKVGFYDAIATTSVGFTIMVEGIGKPFFKVMSLRKQKLATGFGSATLGFNFSYVFLFFFAYFILFAILYMAAERNKNKSYNKDGDMKFGKISEFNKAMAHCNDEGEPVDPPENSYDPGNMILSKNIRYSLEPKGTNTYSCALVIGATGCGKTYTYVKPNILQMNSSYVITDPKGELTSDLGMALMRHGYNVKLFNINEPEYSCYYNPFRYIRCEADVVTAVNVFLENTKEENAGGGDPFFPLAEKNFYLGLFFYIYTVYKDNPEKQNFKTIYELYQSAEEEEVYLRPGESEPESRFDKLFRALAKKDPSNPSLGYYATFKKGSYKTRQSILTSVGVKLWFLSVGSIANMMSTDTLDLETIGDRKTALFIIIPSEKKTFKFLSAMLFTQIFETLYYVGNTLNEKSYFIQKENCVALRSEPFIAGTESETQAIENLKMKRELWRRAVIEDDNELMKTDSVLKKYFDTPNQYGFKPFPKARLVYTDPETNTKRVLEEFQSRAAAEMVYDAICNGKLIRGGKSLTNHVRFMLDEFFSLGKIQDFDLKIATFRSLRISCDIIVQSIAQLKELYEDRESKITNNCSVQILLGAASMDDCKYFSDQIGQTTVRSESVSVNHKGMLQGVDGTNLSDNAQLLIRPEKIRSLNKDRCLVLVNTKMPLWDDKYNSASHKRWYESYVSFSDEEKERTKDNQFQFRRLFFIEQKETNRIVTILKEKKPEKILQDTNKQKKQNIQGRPSFERIGVEPLTNREKLEKVHQRFLEQEQKANEQATKNNINQNIMDALSLITDSDGDVNVADLDSIMEGLGQTIIEAANRNDSGITIEKDGNKNRIVPTADNQIAKAVKAGLITTSQITTDSNDLWD